MALLKETTLLSIITMGMLLQLLCYPTQLQAQIGKDHAWCINSYLPVYHAILKLLLLENFISVAGLSKMHGPDSYSRLLQKRGISN